MTRCLLLVLLPLLALCAFGAAASDQHVAGDALWVKECFILKAPKTTMWNHRRFKNAGAWNIYLGNIICVKEIDRSNGQLWYRVLVIKPRTLDRSQHIPGWIDSNQIMEHGVALAH